MISVKWLVGQFQLPVRLNKLCLLVGEGGHSKGDKERQYTYNVTSLRHVHKTTVAVKN
jgi:hypothetical protein